MSSSNGCARSTPQGPPEDVHRIVELLHGLASPNPARRQQTALATAEDTPATTRILAEALLAEPDTNVAGALRWALARAGDEGVAAVAAGLDSDDAEVRRRAVFTLAGTTGDDAAAVLLRAINDPDAAVREYAALALGGRGEPAAAPVLTEMVVAGTKDVEAGEALGAIARRADEEAIVGALVETLAAHPAEPEVRLRVTQALAELPGDGAAAVLTDLMHDPNRAVALTATAISRMRDRPARTSANYPDDRPRPGH